MEGTTTWKTLYLFNGQDFNIQAKSNFKMLDQILLWYKSA